MSHPLCIWGGTAQQENAVIDRFIQFKYGLQLRQTADRRLGNQEISFHCKIIIESILLIITCHLAVNSFSYLSRKLLLINRRTLWNNCLEISTVPLMTLKCQCRELMHAIYLGVFFILGAAISHIEEKQFSKDYWICTQLNNMRLCCTVMSLNGAWHENSKDGGSRQSDLFS